MMDKQVVPPTERSGLNPFLIPIARSKESKGNGGVLCYIRWPTQKDDMDLQLVETTEVNRHSFAMMDVANSLHAL